jgi:nucleotide-binding universal stress UspA family protein
VRVLCVAEPLVPLPPDSGWEAIIEQVWQDRLLGWWLGQATAWGHALGVPVRLAVAAGRPGQAIARYAARKRSDLLVIGRHEGGRWRGWRGGTVGWLSRHAPCPVLIVG